MGVWKSVLTIKQGRAYEDTSTGTNPLHAGTKIKRSGSGSRSRSSSEVSLPSGIHLEGVTARDLLELPLRVTACGHTPSEIICREGMHLEIICREGMHLCVPAFGHTHTT